MSAAVEFQNVNRHFGDVKAVDNVSFSIPEGEFFSMLGPSGSGKTTCLRLIAGFEHPNHGHILIHNQQTEAMPPYDRDVNTVFQDYALFPHMSIIENVAYSLMVRGVGKKERLAQAQEMLDMVKLPDVGSRKPSQLSGGQRQRIALARALINKPRVLLLDEPLGALDLKLREQMQVELKALQRKVGITFVFVTHDQDEALSMSDRVAVFNNGKIEQIGTPSEIYNKPETKFVAGFVGSTNIISIEDSIKLGLEKGSYSLRPERISITTDSADLTSLKGAVVDMLYHGENTRISVKTDAGMEFIVSMQNKSSDLEGMVTGDQVYLNWSESDMHYLSDIEA